MSIEDRMAEALVELEQGGNLRQLRQMKLDGLRLEHGGKSYLNLSSNDYLGLSCTNYAHYPLGDGNRFMHGNPSSRLMTGNSQDYEELEEELQLLFPTKKALVLGCGFMANCGLPAAIAGKGDLILADKLIHASLIDGLRLGEADWKRFRHNDLAQLEKLLQSAPDGAHVWVIIESIYSMDGDAAPLAEIMELKRRYGFQLMVDEAHAFGVRGPKGKGLCAELGLDEDVDLLMCTFGKAIAGAGACILCSATMRAYFVNRLRPLIFSTALPPITLRWNRFIIHQMRTEELSTKDPERYPSMASLRAHLADLVAILGGCSQIIPLAAGSNERALRMAAQGAEAGYWLTAIRPPTVPQGSARIRLSLSAAFSTEQITNLLTLCKKLG
ncbi:MAG: 8-amino-7-oxononanoate synthase [Akkermansia sp.]